MKCTLAEIANLVDGELKGDGDLEISDAATIRDAVSGHITLAEGESLIERLNSSQASAVVVPRGAQGILLPAIEVDEVAASFARIVAHFRPPRSRSRIGVSPQAYVHESAQVAAGVDVYPGAYVGEDVVVGSGTVIHSGARVLAGCTIGCESQILPNVVIYEDCQIGDRVVLHAGVSIGADGFGYNTVGGRHQLSSQLGNVVIDDDVHIGANSTVDRGTYGETRIGCGTKIDNQVMVAHNCRIGKHNLICAGVGIAGSVITGDYVVLAGQVGIRDHISIGDQAIIGAQAGVMNDVPAGSKLLGSPAFPEREQMLMFAAMTKLPQLRKDFRRLQRAVAELEQAADKKTPTDTNAAKSDAA